MNYIPLVSVNYKNLINTIFSPTHSLPARSTNWSLVLNVTLGWELQTGEEGTKELHIAFGLVIN